MQPAQIPGPTFRQSNVCEMPGKSTLAAGESGFKSRAALDARAMAGATGPIATDREAQGLEDFTDELLVAGATALRDLAELDDILQNG